MLWTFLTSLLQALAGWFKSKSEDQLIELGEKRKQDDVDKTQKEADKISQAEIDLAEDIRNNNSAGDEFLLPPDQRKN